MTEDIKRCTKCGRTLALSAFNLDKRNKDGHRQPCQECEREYGRNHWAEKRSADPEATRQYQRDYWITIKTRVLDYYGNSCACCGSTDHLSIDHVNGDGAGHREELYGNHRHGSGWRFYMWLIRNEFPDGYQTLCRSCNRSKGKGDRCQLDHHTRGAAVHDHGPALSEDAFSPGADDCPFTLAELPCSCQDVHYACGFTDREHDHVDCPG